MAPSLTSSVLAAGSILLVGASVAAAATISNFEAPTYTASTDIDGVDGWALITGTSPGGRVTPDPISAYKPPSYPNLDGDQSFVLFQNGDGYTRGFGSASSQVQGGATLSSLIRSTNSTTTGSGSFYLASNLSGSTPAGITLNESTHHFDLFGKNASTSSVSFADTTTYRLEMVLDFTHQTFEGFITDVTNSGARTSLGTADFYSTLTASGLASSGGVAITKSISGGASYYYDDIQITAVPEPTGIASMGLLVGLAGMLGRRRRTA